MKDESFKDRLERAFDEWWNSDGSAHTGEAAMKWAASFTLSEAEKLAGANIVNAPDGLTDDADGVLRGLADRLKRMREEL